jgi:ATP-binding cassette subfamily F protein 3
VHSSDGEAVVSATVPAPVSSGKKTKEQKRAEAEARNRAYRAGRGDKERLTEVDRELSKAQERHDALIDLMAQPELYSDQAAFDAALAEYTEVKTRIPVLEAEWVALTDAIEKAEQEQ